MKPNELNNLSESELIQKEKALKVELSKLNQQRYLGRIDKPHMMSQVKKDIARIETALTKLGNSSSLKTKAPEPKAK